MPETPKPVDNPLSWLVKHMRPAAPADATAARRAAPPRILPSFLTATGPSAPIDRGVDLPARRSDEISPSPSIAHSARRVAELTGLPDVARAGYNAARLVGDRKPMSAAGVSLAALLPFVGGPEIKAGNAAIEHLAESYLAKAGIQGARALPRIAAVDPEKGALMAKAYEALTSDPAHPDVQRAYAALGRELDAQAQHLLEAGYRPEISTGDPYKGSAEMMADVRDNKRIKYFATSPEQAHPLLTNEQNDKLRWVHDVLGHSVHGNGFGPVGEENAFRAHAALFSPEALPALAAETRGQNSWVNFGPNAHLPASERPFAEQKAALWPDHLLGDYHEMQAPPAFQPATPEAFHGALQEFAKANPTNAAYLSPVTPEEIASSGTRAFLHPSGRAGFTVSPEGTLQSVFNHGEPGLGTRGVAEAVGLHGATSLDAMDNGLSKFYKRFGFTETARDPFDPSQAAPGWDASRMGTPDRVVMSRAGQRPTSPDELLAQYERRKQAAAIPPQVDLPRFVAPRIPKSRIDDIEAEALKTYLGPEHEQWLRQGRFGEWYDTRATKQQAVDALGDEEGPKGFSRLMQMMAAVTARSDPANNLRRASLYRGYEMAGLLDPEALAAGAYKKVPTGMGHLANNAHHAGLLRLLEGGETNSILNPKPAGFDANLNLNWNPFTNDTRMATGAAMANPKLVDLGAIVKSVGKDGGVTYSPQKWAYAPMERAFQQAAKVWQERGLINVPDGFAPAAHGQAQIWDGLSSVLPGASPSQGLFSDVFNTKLAANAKAWGVPISRANQLVWEGHPFDLPLKTNIIPRGLLGR